MTIAVPPPLAEPSLGGGIRRRRLLTESGWALFFLAPSIALFSVFIFYPLVRAVYLGFHRSDPFGLHQKYVGFDQYREVLTSADFQQALWTTFLFALYTVPIGLALGVLLALLANQRLRGMLIFRTVFSSTIASSVAVASVMWLTLLNPNIGIVNYWLDKAGTGRIEWLTGANWSWAPHFGWAPSWFGPGGPALLGVSLATVWLNLGFTFIVALAGLQSIPQELYESSKIDGAGPFSTFRHVTLPLLSPTMLFLVVVLTIFAFESFGQIHILTRGGPLRTTTVIVYAIYQKAFVPPFDKGAASVEALALFVLVLILTLVQFKLIEKRVFYGS